MTYNVWFLGNPINFVFPRFLMFSSTSYRETSGQNSLENKTVFLGIWQCTVKPSRATWWFRFLFFTFPFLILTFWFSLRHLAFRLIFRFLFFYFSVLVFNVLIEFAEIFLRSVLRKLNYYTIYTASPSSTISSCLVKVLVTVYSSTPV